jgi:hypothetical protein
MNLLPCAEHGIQDENQGHREYGSVITVEAGPQPVTRVERGGRRYLD